MKINNYRVNAKRQDNGLYGMPMLCVAYDRLPFFLSEELEVKNSAILLAIAEVEKREFKVSMSNEDGFLVQVVGGRTYYVSYADYDFNDGVLEFKTKFTFESGVNSSDSK